MALSCFSACCSVDTSKKPVALGASRDSPKALNAKEDSKGFGGTSGSEAGGGEADQQGSSFQAQGGRRRGSQIQRNISQGKEGPPEATPEPCSDAVGATASLQASAESLVRDVRSIEGITGAAECEFFYVGVSVSEKPPRKALAIIEPVFDEKICESSVAVGDIPQARAKLAAEQGIAIACRKGKKPEQPNQDNYFFCQTKRFRLCCVADGHGEFGHWVSHLAARAMLRLLLLELAGAEGLPQDDVVAQMFDLVHNAIKYDADWEGFDVALSGTTLSVAIIDRKSQQVLVAWTGDSRCVCARATGGAGSASRPSSPSSPPSPTNSSKANVELVAATADHKPQDPEERRRIIGSGGEVVRLQNDLPHRVFCRGKEAPGLAMSRALGDLMAHSVGVMHVPSFRRFVLEADACLLCCSDGVWEFIKNAEAIKPLMALGRARVAEAVNALALEARNRWLREEGGMLTDDITAIAIWGAPPVA
mmetsp:Transcript_73327/g.184811  ORF Transcript_73327/g.184811 Transcript_73327/m.184811 type:complete len:478 (-) Transcript_73327:164-1597(-)